MWITNNVSMNFAYEEQERTILHSYLGLSTSYNQDRTSFQILEYKLHRKFKVFNKSNLSHKREIKYNLVASSPEHEMIFVASTDGLFAVYRVAELLYSKAVPSREKVKLPVEPTHIAVNCDGELLAVAGNNESILIYNVKDFRNQDPSPKLSLPRGSPFCVCDMQWSPSMNETLAIGFHDKITILHVGTGKRNDNTDYGGKGCFSWRPSGSSLVVGYTDGSLRVYSPDLSLEKSIPAPAPPLFGSASIWVEAVHWMCNNQFAVIYYKGGRRESAFTLITPEGEFPPRVEYVGRLEDDLYFCSYSLLQIKPWNVMLCAALNADIKLLPQDSDGGGSQAPFQLVSELLGEDDLYPVGVALDRGPVLRLSSQSHIPEPTDDGIAHVTLVHVLTQMGDLATYIVSERAPTPSVATRSFNASTASASPSGGGVETTTNSVLGAQPAFGAAATAQPATPGGLFGGTQSSFGGTTTGGFGGGGGFGFGASTSTGGLFLGTPTAQPFQGKPAGTGLFGGTQSSFGGTTTGGFGGGGGFGFGASTSTGGGLFGGSAQAAPLFGTPTVQRFQTKPAGLFGGTQSSFGGTTTGGFGGGGGFGFGASTSTGGLFLGTPTAQPFQGKPAGTGLFGGTQSSFGGTTTGGFGGGGGFGFGASTSTGGGLFGGSAQAAPLFGTPTVQRFQTKPAGLFGGTQSSFGGTTTGGFGGGGFGFGASTSTGGLFLGTPTAQPFQGKPAGTGLFGGTQSSFGGTTTGGFGGGGGFGFGASTSTGGLFLGTPTAQPFQAKPAGGFGQSAARGTAHAKYKPVVGTDVVVKFGAWQNINIKHHCITCMKEYESKSLEELRLEDYSAGRKGSAAGLFGGFWQQPEANPLFNNSGIQGYGGAATTLAPMPSPSPSAALPPFHVGVPEVKFKKLPFYDVLAELMKPTTMLPGQAGRMQEGTYIFHLTPQQYWDIAGLKKHMAQLRFCRLETTCEQDDCFPPSVNVKVNDKTCPLPKRLPQPVNISSLVKLSSTVPNIIQVTWASELTRVYMLSVLMVRKVTSADLLLRLRNKGYKISDYTRSLIIEKLSEDNDSEIATTCRMSLMCPLGEMRMSFPCRPANCPHLQCFDASLFLAMNERNPTWLCPVCDRPALYDSLQIDGYFEDVLTSSRLPSDCNEIQLHADGSWSAHTPLPVQPAAEPDTLISNDLGVEAVSPGGAVISLDSPSPPDPPHRPAAPADHSPRTPDLTFHSVHGENIRISLVGSMASRVESSSGGVAFSARPVRVNEKVCIRFVEISNSWQGVINLGFTTHDPTTLSHALPKTACPDLTNKPGNWAEPLDEIFCEKDNILYYYVNSAGDVHFGVNGDDKGLFFSGVDTRSPLWALVDVYGRCTAVQFVDPRAPSQIRRPNQSPIEERLNSGIRALSVDEPLPQLRYQSPLIPLSLHRTKGRNVQLNDRSVAERIGTEFCQGYVFTARPMRPGLTIVVQILSTETAYADSLAIGLTSCDPATLRPCDLPDDAEQLLDRPEYWVVRRNAASGLGRGDELAVTLTLDGEMRVSRNGSNPVTVMHVDHTVRLWAFVDINGATRKVRMLSSQTAQTPPQQLRLLAGSAQNINTSAGTVLAESLPPQNANQLASVASAHCIEPIQSNLLCSASQNSSNEQLQIPTERDSDEPSTSGAHPHQPVSSVPSERPLTDPECIICCENPIDSALSKCGHMCMCYTCAVQQWTGKGDGQCPLCRAQIKDVIRTYKP